MSDIQRRTIFYEKGSGGEHRYHDWALVTMDNSIGTFLEPFIERVSLVRNCKGGFLNYDATEPMTRIDEVKMLSLDDGLKIYGDRVTGGYLLPRVGR